MKKKLLAVVLIFVATGVAMATDVINVGIRGFNSYEPYVGNGAYNVGPNAVWTAFNGGWGVPVGSSRSEGLVTPNQAGYSGVYAAQVWLGDNGHNHYYIWGSDENLMDNGFVAEPCSTNLSLASSPPGRMSRIFPSGVRMHTRVFMIFMFTAMHRESSG